MCTNKFEFDQMKFRFYLEKELKQKRSQHFGNYERTAIIYNLFKLKNIMWLVNYVEDVMKKGCEVVEEDHGRERCE